MSDNVGNTSVGGPSSKRKRTDDASADEKAERTNNFVRNYLAVGAKLWVVTIHIFGASDGRVYLDHREFVFADKNMAKAARDIMIETYMTQYIYDQYYGKDVCVSADEEHCWCRSCGEVQLALLHQDPVSFAKENFEEVQLNSYGRDLFDDESYIKLTEWRPPVVLSSLSNDMLSPLCSSTTDITKTHAYAKYYPVVPTEAETTIV